MTISKHQKSMIDIIKNKGSLYEKSGRSVMAIDADRLFYHMLRRYHIPFKPYFRQGSYHQRRAWEQSTHGKKYHVFHSSCSRSLKRLVEHDVLYISVNNKICYEKRR
jgi:hypothetical protein